MSDTKGEEKHVRVVCEDFWEDGILDEYYEQLGKEIYQREKDKVVEETKQVFDDRDGIPTIRDVNQEDMERIN
jgi:hypothetical protein|tara:strand:+ start:10 stop:228 length:219 start_codon:yes stop_codon:yes gene_type:complete